MPDRVAGKMPLSRLVSWVALADLHMQMSSSSILLQHPLISNCLNQIINQFAFSARKLLKIAFTKAGILVYILVRIIYAKKTSAYLAVQGIIRSVRDEAKEVQHFDSSPLPDKDVLYRVISDIFMLLFPGYYGHSEMSFDSIEMRIGYRVARVYEEFRPQVHRELIHGCQKACSPCGNCERAAEQLVFQFRYVPELRC